MIDMIEQENTKSFVSDKPLTKWAKEPSVLALKDDLDTAKVVTDLWALKIKHWNDLRNVEGAAKPKAAKTRSQVQPKLIRRLAEWRYSALSEPFLSAQKLFNADPHTFEDEDAARQNEIVLNWQFRTKMNKVKFVDEYVRTAVDEGSVIVQTGWERHTRNVKKRVPVFTYLEIMDEAEAEPLKAALDARAANPRSFFELPVEMQAAIEYFDETGVPNVAKITGSEEIEEEEVLSNKPTVKIHNPANVFIDPGCEGDITKAQFAIVSFETTQAALRKDKRYKNLDRVLWSANTILAQPDHETNTPNARQLRDDLRRTVVAYEYWGFYDVHGTGELVPIVATWIGDTMIRMEENPFPDQALPFVVVPYLPVKRELLGEPDAELLEDNQAIMGAVTRGMIDLMGRSANAQQGHAKGFLDAVNKRRFERGEDYEYNPNGGDPRISIFQHLYPEIPNSAITMIGLQNNEAEALSGVKAFAGGISGETYGEVAAGIKSMLDAAAKREMNILRRLAQGMIEIGVKFAMMNAVFMSEEEVIRVTNQQYVSVRREDLKGNFDIIVDIATPEVDEAKAQDLGFMLQTMGPDMDPEMSRMILAEIAELKRMPALAQKIRTYQPQPDPIQEETRKLELEKLRMEVAKLQSESELKQAQAQKALAEADQADLDFVEQETGTKHARDMEKQSAQARANQDLEVTKGLLATAKPDEAKPDITAAVGFNALTDTMAQART